MNFGEVYLKYTSQDYTQENSYYLLTKVHANSQSMQLQFYDTFVNDQGTTKNTKIVYVACNVYEGEVNYALINTYDIASSASGGSGAIVKFITQGNEYTRPFILEDAEPGVYGFQQNNMLGSISQKEIYLKTTSSSNYFTINNPVEPYIYVQTKYSDDLPNGTIIAWVNTLGADESLTTKVIKKSNSGVSLYDMQGLSRYVKDNQIESLIKKISGYDATKTQVLKNVNGTLTWVDE